MRILVRDAPVNKIERFRSRVPTCEEDLILFILHRHGGQEVLLTPRQAVRVLDGPKRIVSMVGQAFRQQSVAQGEIQIPSSDLVLTRLQKKRDMVPEEQRDKTIISRYSGESVSPNSRVDEVERGTELGIELRKTHERYLWWLRKQYKEA